MVNMSDEDINEVYKKRRSQIALAKSLSSKAKHELLATALDGRDLYKTYITCPKCNVPAGLAVVYGYPSKETMKAECNGEISLGGCVIEADNFGNFCLNCNFTWNEDDLEGVDDLDDADDSNLFNGVD